MHAFVVDIANAAVAEFSGKNRFFLEKLVEDKLHAAEQSYNSTTLLGHGVIQMV